MINFIKSLIIDRIDCDLEKNIIFENIYFSTKSVKQNYWDVLLWTLLSNG